MVASGWESLHQGFRLREAAYVPVDGPIPFYIQAWYLQ